MKPQRIVVISNHTPALLWHRMDMMIEFLKRGHSVYALANAEESKWVDFFEKNGIVYKQISIDKHGLSPVRDLTTVCSIRHMLKIIKPDKIFTCYAKPNIYGTLAARWIGIQAIYPMISGVGSLFLSHSLRFRVLRLIMTFLYRYTIKNCPVVFFQNKDDVDIFNGLGIIKKQNVVMLPGSGVNTDFFTVTPLPDHVSFLCVSRLIKDKGIGEYLEACRIVKRWRPEVRCMLVGPYDTNPSALKPVDLNPYIEDSSVEYFGEQSDVRPFITQSSVFVLPSYREGTPKAVLEAMACGRAVITTDAPGCRETVSNGKNGFLVSPRNVEELAERMKWFVEHPETVATMGVCGRQIVEEVFDVRKVNALICDAMGV